MEEILLNYKVLNPTGYLHYKVPQDVFSVVLQEVNSLIETDFKNASNYNRQLAGLIEKEYRLYQCEAALNRLFKHVIPKYWEFNDNIINTKKVYQIKKDNTNQPYIWANFQKKYEYNPTHNHSGEISFVLYIKIPYDITEERKMLHVNNSINQLTPSFSFVYPSFPPEFDHDVQNISLVKRKDLYLTSKDEGLMLLFPSWLQHQVTPFYTSDDYRISVAGNLVSVNNG